MSGLSVCAATCNQEQQNAVTAQSTLNQLRGWYKQVKSTLLPNQQQPQGPQQYQQKWTGRGAWLRSTQPSHCMPARVAVQNNSKPTIACLLKPAIQNHHLLHVGEGISIEGTTHPSSPLHTSLNTPAPSSTPGKHTLLRVSYSPKKLQGFAEPAHRTL